MKTKKRDALSTLSRFVPEVGMTVALASLGSVNPKRWAYSTVQKSPHKRIEVTFFTLFKNRTPKASPSFFDSASTNLLKQAWEFDLSLSQALCFVFCFFDEKNPPGGAALLTFGARSGNRTHTPCGTRV